MYNIHKEAFSSSPVINYNFRFSALPLLISHFHHSIPFIPTSTTIAHYIEVPLNILYIHTCTNIGYIFLCYLTHILYSKMKIIITKSLFFHENNMCTVIYTRDFFQNTNR